MPRPAVFTYAQCNANSQLVHKTFNPLDLVDQREETNNKQHVVVHPVSILLFSIHAESSDICLQLQRHSHPHLLNGPQYSVKCFRIHVNQHLQSLLVQRIAKNILPPFLFCRHANFINQHLQESVESSTLEISWAFPSAPKHQNSFLSSIWLHKGGCLHGCGAADVVHCPLTPKNRPAARA